jgi:serine/threonine-protein kinase
MDLTPGTVIEGKYRIVRLLGQGGMGAVYEGANTRISRRVAIKVLHASLAAKETVVRRFEQEAKAAGLIGSEHICEVLDIGSLPSGELYMVMEFLDGEDLGSRIKKLRRLKPHDAANIVHQLLEGLTAAHKAGIIHRDLKPENVYLVTSRAGRRDFVKVLDFGVSKFSALDGESMSMTSTGAVVGTPYYLSPEQARGLKTIDARSDLYSVGVVLYQAVTGRLPFNAETFNELVFKIALEEPEPAEVVVPNLDRRFAAIISRAMVRDVNGRFQSAREFQEALEQWLAMNPSPDPRPSVAGYQAAPAAARAGTMPLDQVQQPAHWTAPAPQPSHPGGYQASAPGAPAGYAAQPPGGSGMRSGAYAPQGMPSGGAYGSPGGYQQPGGYAGAPMAAPMNTPMNTPGTMPAGAPMTTPQPGEVPVSAAPPKKRGFAVAAAIVGAISIGGGAYMLFGRGNPQGGAATTTPTTQPTPEAPPTAPSQAPSVEATAGSEKPETAPSASSAALAPTAPPNTASAASTTPNTNPIGTNTNTSNTTNTKPPGILPPGTSRTAAPTPTAPTATTAPPKPTGRVIGSDL